MRKRRLLSLLMAIVLIIGLLPLHAFAASNTGSGISVTTNPNHFIRRVNHHGNEYTYKPPLVDGKWGYCVDFGYSYNSEDANFRSSYSWTHATGSDAEDLFDRALIISGMADFAPEVVENAKWLMSYINQHYTLSDNELGAWLMTVQTYLWDNMERKAYGDTADANSNVDDGGYADVSRYERYQELYTWLLGIKEEEDAELQRQVDDFAAQGMDAYITVDPDSQWAVYATSSISGRQGFFNYNEKRVVRSGERPEDPDDPPSGDGGVITITKRDSRTNEPLAGATYRIEGIDQAYDNSVTTGRNGTATIEELFSGSYKIYEVGAPEGYLPSNEVQTVHYDGERSIDITFHNDPLSIIELQKQDAQTGDPVSAVFDVFKDTQHIDTIRVDGSYTLSGLSEGTYTFVEVSCPGNYILDPTPHSIHVDPSSTHTVTYDLLVPNTKKPGLELIKYDRLSNRPLPDVTFAVYRDAELYGQYTTGPDGRIYLDNLLPGTYLAYEVSSDDDHIVNSTPQQIEIKAGDTVKTLVFFNDLKPGIHLVKVDRADLSKPIANAKFRFEAVDGSWGPEEMTTLEDGTIDLSRLPEGAYVVTELECPGFVIDDAQRIVQLKPNETAAFVFTNSKLPSLLLKKESADGTPLSGVSFRLAKIEDGTYYLDRTTSTTGEILWEGLEPGVYSLCEISTVSDHILDTREYHVELYSGKTSTKVIQNQRRPNLYVYKHDADNGNPIADTVFEVRAVDGHSVDQIRTGKDGRAELKNLLPGVYQITEKSVPSPWLMDAEPQLVTLYPNRDHTAYFTNHKRPIVEIVKENAVTFERLANVPFHVWYASNNTSTGEMNDLGVFYTNADGRIELDGTKMGTLGLRDGWFRVQELEPLTGFAKADPDTQEAFVPAGQGHTFVFRNQPLSAICVWKYDSLNPNTAIEGAVFQVRYLSGNTSGTGGTVIGTYCTSANGSFTVTGLQKGTYIVEELSSDGSHVIDTPPQTAYLSGEKQEAIQLYFGNSPKGSLLVSKVGDSGEPLEGVEFLVTKSDGTLVGDANGKFTTGLDGTFLVENVDPNTTLVVKETMAKPGYVLDDVAQTAVIKAGQTVKLRFINHKKGSLVIHKLSSLDKSPLEGAQFKLTYADGRVVDTADGKLSSNGLYWSNAAGQIVIPNITGTIIATELSSAPGFAIDPNTRTQTVTVNPGDTQSLYFYNDPLCSLTLTKLDSVNGKPVPNTVFSVKDGNGNLIGRYTTGKDGTVTVTGLLPGSTVVVSEYKVPDTHVLNPMPQTITLQSGKNTVTSGAVSSGSGNGNGLVFENDPKMTLTVKKYIKGTNYEPLAGVGFKIVDGSGRPVGTGDGVFYTNAAGEIVVDGLEPGITVTAREISTVDGFVLDGEPKSVQIKASEKGAELVFWNEKAGSLIIQKKSSLDGSPLAGVQFLLTYADGSYVDCDNGHMSSKGLYETDQNGEIRISGIVGTVVAKELKTLPGFTIDPATQTQTVQINPDDCQTLVFYNAPVGNFELIKVVEGNETKRIPNVTFEIRRASDGGLVDTITTGSDGRATLQLAAGDYYAVETECPKEFKLDSTPHYFTMQDGKNTTLPVKNKAFSGILIHKTDSSTGKGIYGVSFLLYDTTNTPIGQYTSDDRGFVYIDDLTGSGLYYLRELENEGYVPDTQMKTVYVKAGETSRVEWKNTPITGQVQVTKTSADYNSMNGWPAGTPIPGTVFEIYHYRTGNLVDTIRTDKNGVAVSKPLPLGRYQVVESQAADFYGLDKTPIDVEIEYAGQIVKAAMTNQSLYTNVSIKKTGFVEVMPGQQLRYDVTEIANNSTTALTSFYWRDTLPTQAVRLEKIVTGTYNVQGNYKIVYKTNYSGETYRTLADNLSTQQNYVLDASPAALGLSAGECVTEFMVSFGVVPGNFRCVETPRVYCTVLPQLAGGTQFVNTADVGGVYNGQWIMAASRWVTKVYAPSKPLPRTGY